MAIKTAYSNNVNVNEAVKDISSAFSGSENKLVIFFASSNYDQAALATGMSDSFKESTVFGCTTAGEIITGKVLKNSLVAMSFESEDIKDCKVEVLENVKEITSLDQVFENFEKYFNKSMSDMDSTKTVGIVLVDGLSGSEEKLMNLLGDKTDMVFVGGSAGDDLKFKATYLFANGRAYTNAAILAVLDTTHGFEILKTQSFEASDKTLVATRVDEANREVLEFNNQPATQAYAEAVNVSIDKVSEAFMGHPVGLMINNEPYVRSPQQVVGDKIKFYCNIKEGTTLSVLNSRDIVADTKEDLDKKLAESKIRGILNFNCILRALELDSKKQNEAYGELFKVETLGFSTYGEEYLGHINQTATMILFK